MRTCCNLTLLRHASRPYTATRRRPRPPQPRPSCACARSCLCTRRCPFPWRVCLIRSCIVRLNKSDARMSTCPSRHRRVRHEFPPPPPCATWHVTLTSVPGRLPLPRAMMNACRSHRRHVRHVAQYLVQLPAEVRRAGLEPLHQRHHAGQLGLGESKGRGERGQARGAGQVSKCCLTREHVFQHGKARWLIKSQARSRPSASRRAAHGPPAFPPPARPSPRLPHPVSPPAVSPSNRQTPSSPLHLPPAHPIVPTCALASSSPTAPGSSTAGRYRPASRSWG